MPIILTIMMAHEAGYPKEDIINSEMYQLNRSPELDILIDTVYATGS